MTDLPLPGQPVDLPLPPEVDRAFGYHGQARYVAFHWSPCGDELVFEDARRSGTGHSWAFLVFRRHRAVKPLLRGWNLGASDAEPEHALVIDRHAHRASMAPLHEARAFLEDQHPPESPLTPAQVEGLRRQVEERAKRGWEEVPVDPAEVQRLMSEQRARVGRLKGWLDMCPEPPQEGREA
jgi:hypothetical protein